jgi:gluconokinase
MIVVVMGVAGSGKTTVGKLLAEKLDWPFIEGDHLHPPSNVEKMRSKQSLSESDRASWLVRIAAELREITDRAGSAVLAASALRIAHRDRIRSSGKDVHFVYLRGEFEQIKARLEQRSDHFFGVDLLASQFEILEEPESAIEIDSSLDPSEIIREIREALRV